MAIELAPVLYERPSPGVSQAHFRAFSGPQEGMFGSLHLPYERSYLTDDFQIVMAIGGSGLSGVLRGRAHFETRDAAMQFLSDPAAIADCVSRMQPPSPDTQFIFYLESK